MSQQGKLTSISTSASYPITPFVVGPSGQAGYQTIQSAINAANVAGGGTIYIQAGTYVENLILFDLVYLRGVAWTDSASVIISGQHTAPATGTVQFEGLFLSHATAIFNDNSSKNVTFNIINTLINVTNGTAFNVANFSGTMNLYDCVFISSNDSIFNNSSGSMTFETFDCALGIGSSTGNIQVNGNALLDNSIMWTTYTMTNGTLFAGNGSTFHNTLIFNGNSTGGVYTSQILSGLAPAITMSSSGSFTVSECVINSTNNPAISGGGIGLLTLTGLSFINNSNISGALTTSYVPFISGEIRAGSDIGGATGFTSLTKTNSTTIGAGVGVIKMSSANNADNSAWIKIYIGTTAYWIPAWTTNSP